LSGSFESNRFWRFAANEAHGRVQVFVTFYRGGWRPYCNIDLQAIEESATEIRMQGASLVAISQQMPANSLRSQRDNRLSFPILSDHGGRVVKAFGIRWDLPEYLQAAFKMFKIDLASVNGEPSWTLPMPGRFIIGTNGVIVYAEINPDYTHRPDPGELLPILEKLKLALLHKAQSSKKTKH
jgi:peroxiredoxin